MVDARRSRRQARKITAPAERGLQALACATGMMGNNSIRHDG